MDVRGLRQFLQPPVTIKLSPIDVMTGPQIRYSRYNSGSTSTESCLVSMVLIDLQLNASRGNQYTTFILCFLTDCVSVRESEGQVAVLFGSTDARVGLRSVGEDPRWPQWSPTASGYDMAARPLRIFGLSPFRRLKASFAVDLPRSDLPDGDRDIAASTKVKWESKPRRGPELVSVYTQTPLNGYRSRSSGHYVFRWPSSVRAPYSPKQKERQTDRLQLHLLHKDLQKEMVSFASAHPSVLHLYSLPYYLKIKSAENSKFHLLYSQIILISCISRNGSNV